MPDRLPTSRRRWIFAVAMLVPLLSLVAIGLLTHKISSHLAAANEEIHRLTELRAGVASVLTSMLDNEAGQRGYILSQNPQFLEPYEHSLSTLPVLRKVLGTLILDDKGRALLAALEKSIDARLHFSAETVSLQRANEHEMVVALVATGRGRTLMDQVRSDVVALERHFEEMTRLVEEDYASVVRWSERISWATVALNAVLIGLLVFLFIRLRRAEQFLHVCAWSRTAEYGGEWISFEQYLEKKFGLSISHGISPQETKKLRESLGEEHPGMSKG